MYLKLIQSNYTIPSDNRELQRSAIVRAAATDYTIPSDNRELQPSAFVAVTAWNYTIPSDNRELQHAIGKGISIMIIPYQVITGNYNTGGGAPWRADIIPYQVITGNYNKT